MELFAEIVPLIKLPRSLGVFDYKIPEKLNGLVLPGQIAAMPFRNQIIYGLVIKVKEASPQNFKFKEIKEIIVQKILAPYQIDLARWISEYYFQSPALVLKSIIPKIPKKFVRENFQISEILPEKPETENELSQYKKILFIGDGIDKIADLIQKNKLKSMQSLILAPEIFQIKNLIEEYKKYFKPEEMVIFTGELKISKTYEIWQKVLNNEIKIIFGTRKAIFLPFTALGLIVLENEEDLSYKQWDSNPRYHTRDVALKISEATGAQIILKSKAPSTISFSNNDFFKFYSQKTFCQPVIIDMREESHETKKLSLSDELLKQIDENGGNSLILASRKGSYSLVSCRDCGFTPACPKCGIFYKYYENDVEKLICNSCKGISYMPIKCPTCQGTRFKFTGKGTQKIAQELKKLFPQKTIIYFDSDIDSQSSEKIINEFVKSENQIMVATAPILNILPPNFKFGFGAILSFDSLLCQPSFLASEKSWQTIIKLLSHSKSCLIQTFKSDNFVLKSAFSADFKNFYENDLGQREIFSYPPFSKLIKIIIQDRNKKTAEELADKLFYKLNQLAFSQSQIEILGPIAPYIHYVRGRYRKYIVIKTKKSAPETKNLINVVPQDYLLDIDPAELE